MAQDPLLVDQIQIEPGASGTRLIRRATDGSIQFTDSRIPGGIVLANLAGLRSMSNVLVVGKGGAGSAYTAIQAALDTIPAGPGPWFVLVGPGVYAETINLVRDDVHLFGFGATIVAAELVPNGPGAYHTVVIQAALGTIPRNISFHNFTIGNVHNNYACVRVVGAAGSSVGLQGIQFYDCDLLATGSSSKPLWATSANIIRLAGGRATSSDSAQITIADCAEVTIQGVLDLPALDLSYAAAGSPPLSPSTHYLLDSCVAGTSLLSPYLAASLVGGGGLLVQNCVFSSGNCNFSGDRTVQVQGSSLDGVTTACATTLVGCSRGTVAGTGPLNESLVSGSVAFAGHLTRSITFAVPQSNAAYQVALELDTSPAGVGVPWVTAKTAAGFTINFAVAQTLTVYWTTMRRL